MTPSSTLNPMLRRARECLLKQLGVVALVDKPADDPKKPLALDLLRSPRPRVPWDPCQALVGRRRGDYPEHGRPLGLSD